MEYHDFDSQWKDFSLTADGKLLFVDDSAYLLSDDSDSRMSFDDWAKDELIQYVRAIKGLTASSMSGNFASPEGFLHRKLEHTNPNTTPVADNVGWALFVLMIADQVQYDPEIEHFVELLIKRHAGLHEDGKGGVKSIDGHFVRNYNSDGTVKEEDPQYQVYTSMKFLPAAIKAAEMYPSNQNIQNYAKYLKQIFKRSGDVVRAEQRITWDSDDFGPVRLNRLMSNETWLFGDIAAAQDPIASRNYGTFVYDRDNFDFDYALWDQPVIKSSHSGFIVMGGPLILEHHYSDPSWSAHNENYYALTQSETDEMGFPYFAGFSAGHSPNSSGNYYNDGPLDHPDNFIHFPVVKGFGQFGKTEAVVGAYMAYRDKRRKTYLNEGNMNSNLLIRWSANMPDYDQVSVGIADFWYGAIGLAETIKPGTVGKFRNTFYRPSTKLETDSQGRQVVLFSALTPRRIIGVSSDNKQFDFGYHGSPFTVTNGETYERFEVEDPIGDWVELNDVVGVNNITAPLIGREVIFSNPSFEQGVSIGWDTVSGSAINGVASQGIGAQLSGDSIISQAIYLPFGSDGSKYLVSAYVEPISGAGKARVRVSWSDTGDLADAADITESPNLFADKSPKVRVLETTQPAGAKYLHIEYITENNGVFVFNNTSLQSLGVDQAISNGNFEQGYNDWTVSGNVNITSDADELIEGTSSLKFDLSGGITSWQGAERRIDISGDPVGTRYIVRMKTGERDLTDAKFEIKFDIENPQSIPNSEAEPTDDWRDVGFIDNSTPEYLAVTVRKRPGETALNLVLRMKQDDDNTGQNFVIIDDVQLFTEKVLEDDYCSIGSRCD